MRIVLVAVDVTPVNALKQLGEELRAFGHETVEFFGRDLGWDVAIKAIEHPQTLAVVSGMSSSDVLATPELWACQKASEQGKMLALFSDTFQCHRRKWFLEHGGAPNIVFVPTGSEVPDAIECYPHAFIVPSGNPMREDIKPLSYADIKLARSYLHFDKEYVILVPGNKLKENNIELLEFAGEACRGLSKTLVFTRHPGDVTPKSEYELVLANNNIVHNDSWKSDTVLAACQCVVSAMSPSTDERAVYSRIPVVNVAGLVISERIRSETGDVIPPLVKQGVVHFAANIATLRALMCLDERDLQEPLNRVQTQLYPTPPVKGTAVRIMRENIERWFASK